jgi:hypothetical protein
MENTFNQFIAIGAGVTLCLLAMCFMYRDAVSRITEALLDAVELTLARRASRKVSRSRDEIHLTLLNHQ